MIRNKKLVALREANRLFILAITHLIAEHYQFDK